MRAAAVLTMLMLACGGCGTAGIAPIVPAAPTARSAQLHGLFGDNMVLQRDLPISIFGSAEGPGTVIVSLDEATAVAYVSSDGRWRAEFAARPAGGPCTIKVTGRDGMITLRNVMIGEVWVCSGQSNMAMRLSACRNPAAVAEANYPNIRLLTVPAQFRAKPQDDLRAQWAPCTPEAAGEFSATAYYFGRKLHRELNVPIGLINASCGGTTAECWTSEAALKANDKLSLILDHYKRVSKEFRVHWAQYFREFPRWMDAYPETRELFHRDEGNAGLANGWAEANFDDTAWRTIELPGSLNGAIDHNGAFWFRREVDISAEWAGKDLELVLSYIDDFDVTYFNGVQVGATGGNCMLTYACPRSYRVPAELVKQGKASIAIRLFDHAGSGGFAGEEFVIRGPGGDEIDLSGPWKYVVEKALPRLEMPNLPKNMPHAPPRLLRPAGLYNAMIHPMQAFGMRGAIWYQGESNSLASEQYKVLLPAMIADWRRQFGHEMPFLIVQLPAYPFDTSPMREAQAVVAKDVPKTGLAVICDLPDMDLHPKIKEPVGTRLALLALSDTYGLKVASKSPSYKSMAVENGRVRLTFDNVGSGLVVRDGGKLSGFVIAGSDHNFVPAEAIIEGQKVVVWSEKVPAPTAVRYAWTGPSHTANLSNADGLPCGTFRTDNWPLTTK